MKALSFLASIILIVSFSCSGPKTETVTNPTANYSLEKNEGWLSQVEGSAIRFLKPSATVEKQTGILMVTRVDGTFDNLDDNFNYELSFLPESLVAFKQIEEGTAKINDQPARWVKFSDLRNGVEFITIIYVLQDEGTKCIAFNCSSPKASFPEFEDELKQMVASFKKS